jgi:multiple sugar transport system permease protein/putative aldouronate transport system permease protein
MKKFKISYDEKILMIFCYLLVGISAILCLLPFLFIISASFSKESTLINEGYSLIPKEISLEAYKMVLWGEQIWNSYKVSIFVTVVGTFLSLFFSSLLAYPLSTKQLKYGNVINFYVYFTMLFSGGLVPTYMLISRYMKLTNTVWVLILPVLIIPWNMFLLRNFYASIPASLAESAKIDGANDLKVMIRIIFPCSKPALATVGLFYALGYWNEWFKAMLYNSGDKTTWPLQYLIMQLIRKAETIANMAAEGLNVSASNMPSSTMKMATALCTIGPIILVYPFVQRYFTGGIMVGSVKG